MVERVEVITIMLIKITSFSLRYFFVLSKLLSQHNCQNHDHQVKDVRVPAQLMRAMAAEAEAAREARAKVTTSS